MPLKDKWEKFWYSSYTTNFATLKPCLFTSFGFPVTCRRVSHPFVERFHYLIVVCNLVVNSKWKSKFSQFTHTILHQDINVIIKLIIMLTLRSSSMGSSNVSASFSPQFFLGSLLNHALTSSCA